MDTTLKKTVISTRYGYFSRRPFDTISLIMDLMRNNNIILLHAYLYNSIVIVGIGRYQIKRGTKKKKKKNINITYLKFNKSSCSKSIRKISRLLVYEYVIYQWAFVRLIMKKKIIWKCCVANVSIFKFMHVYIIYAYDYYLCANTNYNN